MVRSPSPEALEAFGITDHPTPLPGGRGQLWRAGAAVFKPSDAHLDEARGLVQIESRGVPLRGFEPSRRCWGWRWTRYDR